jgi:hypothetical protein
MTDNDPIRLGARITLYGIKRRGLANLKSREWWLGRRVSIWSREHAAWWGANGCDYTRDLDKAGILDFADAYDRTKYSVQEKKILYYDRAPIWDI